MDLRLLDVGLLRYLKKAFTLEEKVVSLPLQRALKAWSYLKGLVLSSYSILKSVNMLNRRIVL